TIEPGTVVKLDEYCWLNVDGVLLAQGTSSNQIVFTANWDDTYGGDTGDGSYGWDTIRLDGNGSVLDYVLVRYGGRSSASSSGYRSMLYINSNSVVRNSTIEHQQGYTNMPYAAVSIGALGQLRDSLIRDNMYGVYVTSSSASLVGNTIISNSYPIVQHPNVSLDYSGNALTGNTYDAVVVFANNDITADATWSSALTNGLPYVLHGYYYSVWHYDLEIRAGATLTIEPGTVVKLDEYCWLNVDGVLLAQGT
ncbi:unnamed protein product, partial [marine sediment metagenome]